ncbi:hypothetical protein GCM10007047_01630 [Cerasicoccus arenae]|uniref:Uncharacterized protein n=1 Tax=Cerasicoccus arenae TaxID=424488 RepID=A0A8J3GCM5_9BACT|nr:hypothetical protein GCM10007047_01630 [Cerasicoccus arenae]
MDAQPATDLSPGTLQRSKHLGGDAVLALRAQTFFFQGDLQGLNLKKLIGHDLLELIRFPF